VVLRALGNGTLGNGTFGNGALGALGKDALGNGVLGAIGGASGSAATSVVSLVDGASRPRRGAVAAMSRPSARLASNPTRTRSTR
jgi:ABC-type molybdate transport system ATPase subunit